MCGIAGIVGTGVERASLEAMVAAQKHRGPDDYGVWIDAKRTVGLGHNRLSIIDLSPAGHQPMTDGQGLWLVFNGEIYNYQALRRELVGYRFRSECDTEVILAAWRRWGKACLERFVGMFAFALWDDRNRYLFCARDRLGIKPFQYAWDGSRFSFASEAKAILAAGHRAQPDTRIWATYLVHGIYDHSDRTFFAGVNSLPPGHYAELRDGKFTISRYWDPRATEDQVLQVSDDQAADQLNALFEDSVRLRLRADVPVGVNLSGGLDSSMLMSVVDRLSGPDAGAEIETFTASFGDPRYDENSFADSIPRRNTWRRHVVRLAPEECGSLLESGLWYQEAPFGGVATVAYHKLHAEARRRGIIVLLEGQGADETFAGYPYFLPAYWCDLLKSRQYQLLRCELGALPVDERRKWLNHTRSLLRTGALSVHYDGTKHVRTAGLSTHLIGNADSDFCFDIADPSNLRSALWRDTRYTKLPRVLRMNDRLSMASSTELREPYLDHRVVEFAFRLPASQKIRSSQGKFVQRHAMRHLLPGSVTQHSKRMVVTPQREWLRGPLRAFVEDTISSRSFAERGWFDQKEARSTFDRFVQGEGDNSFFVWQWLNTELWCRKFIDGANRHPSLSLADLYPACNGNRAVAIPDLLKP